MKEQLNNIPAPGSIQQRFENLCSNTDQNKGSLSINITENRYLNPHIEWMWKQFLKAYQG